VLPKLLPNTWPVIEDVLASVKVLTPAIAYPDALVMVPELNRLTDELEPEILIVAASTSEDEIVPLLIIEPEKWPKLTPSRECLQSGPHC
jgi:hypothetical protein